MEEIILKIKKRFMIKFEYGIDAIEEVLSTDSGRYNEFVLLRGRYNRLRDYMNSSTLDFEKIDIAENKIHKTFLDLVDDLEFSDLKKRNLNDGIANKSLANRRVNFFRIIDIYMQNLNALSFSFDDTNNSVFNEGKVYGREALYQIYKAMVAGYSLEYFEKNHSSSLENSREYVRQFFYRNEKGLIEVYLKSIKHILEYVNEDEVDKPFFINTFKSLLSRFELVLLFYFSLLKENVSLRILLRENHVLDKEEISELFFDRTHIDVFERYFA